VATFTIEARERSSGARAGVLRTGHGEVHTPAFVPLATKATVKGLLAGEVAALGYEMVLGNTFHLLLSPGPEVIERLGGLHRFMGWERPIITDSGGFQVFSMGHGRVADEIKGSRQRGPAESQRADGATDGAAAIDLDPVADGAPASKGAVLRIDERGVRFRSYVDGRELLLTPEGSMQAQAALGSDIALAFDECTPFRVEREYTEHSTERTHRWLERCLQWHAEHGPSAQLVFGISQGGVFEDLRRASTRTVAASGCDGIAIGGSLGATRAQMYEVVGFALAELGGEHDVLPRHLLGIGEVEDLIEGVRLGVDTFDCAMPTRIGRHGSALVADAHEDAQDAGAAESGAKGEDDADNSTRRWRIDLTKARWQDDERPLLAGCPCPACATGLSRAYLSYLVRAKELTGVRLLSAHNLAFLASLMSDLRRGILDGRLDEVIGAWRAGRPLARAG
jgi:queuine tRNA-ribosyltransferase